MKTACKTLHPDAAKRSLEPHITNSLEATDVKPSILAPKWEVGAVQEAAAPRGGVVRECFHEFAGRGGGDIKDNDSTCETRNAFV